MGVDDAVFDFYWSGGDNKVGGVGNPTGGQEPQAMCHT